MLDTRLCFLDESCADPSPRQLRLQNIPHSDWLLPSSSDTASQVGSSVACKRVGANDRSGRSKRRLQKLCEIAQLTDSITPQLSAGPDLERKTIARACLEGHCPVNSETRGGGLERKQARAGSHGAEGPCTQVLINLGASNEEGIVGQIVGQGRQLREASQCNQARRRSARLAKHERPSARELLGKRPRKRLEDSGDRLIKRMPPARKRGKPALRLAGGIGSGVRRLERSTQIVCISDTPAVSLPASVPLPRDKCCVGTWQELQEGTQLDGAIWKPMRLHGRGFYEALLKAVDGEANLKACEWGGTLRRHQVANTEEVLLEMVPERVGRGSHDRVQVAESPFSWHSHAILGDSWPNLPSTADLLGVARESNLHAGGRGYVHLIVTPIGTWLLHATEKLVRDMYDGSTRREAEANLDLRLRLIFDEHKCSVGYLPGVVPMEQPDFWMDRDEHEGAIREALAAGAVEDQVRRYAKQLQGAGFVVSFAGHGAAETCFPLLCKPASREQKRPPLSHC